MGTLKQLVLALGLVGAVTFGVFAQSPIKGYATQLKLDAPTEPGAAQVLTGWGAPDALGIFVELWCLPAQGGQAQSVASVEVESGGLFAFPDVDVNPGDQFYVTLSRSWHFDRDGDFEGWNQLVSRDATLEVSGGLLKVAIRDGDGDGWRDPYFQNQFDYNPDYYRVIEIRLRNPASLDPSVLGVYWGPLYNARISQHDAVLPREMAEFETIFMPMNIGEHKIYPPPYAADVDGLWVADGINKILRIDPINNTPQFNTTIDGVVLENDYIRIREDVRLDFHQDGDLCGIGVAENLSNLVVSGGALSYTAGAQPALGFDLMTGWIEPGIFTHFVLGLDNLAVARPVNAVQLLFRDGDSGDAYYDDGGTLQAVQVVVNLQGRQDLYVDLDATTVPAGEWSEDARVSPEGMRLYVPLDAESGDAIQIDYLGFVPANPFGPSDLVGTEPVIVNEPPVAVISPDPDPPEVELASDETAEILLDGSASNDGDDGTQPLTFQWEKVSGPDGDEIDLPDRPLVKVKFRKPGKYIYRLTVDDAQGEDSVATAEIEATVLIHEPLFLRGDANTNGIAMEICDATHLIKYLLSLRCRRKANTVELACPDAGDVDDDGSLDLRDAIGILLYHFGADVPPEPFAECGVDPTPDELSECSYPEEMCAAAQVDERLIERMAKQKAKGKKQCKKKK